MCPDCGVSNLDDDETNEKLTNTWEEENYSTHNPEEKEWMEQRLNEIVEEINTTSMDKQALRKDLEELDTCMTKIARDVYEMRDNMGAEFQNQKDFIKSSQEDDLVA